MKNNPGCGVAQDGRDATRHNRVPGLRNRVEAAAWKFLLELAIWAPRISAGEVEALHPFDHLE